MTTPLYHFVRRYAEDAPVRLHMPGHKGVPFLGCEALDITEVEGTDGLIEASEENAAALFGSGATLYSTEGSSHCIRAMLCLAVQERPGAPILAARNAHKAFVSAAALCGAEVVWLRPEQRYSLCECLVSPRSLEAALKALPRPPAGVYVTSPDYLGNLSDIAGLAEVCSRFDTPLLVDNAHGAYLRFLPESLHPLSLGAAMCCDSAHKTLPVLTGGAYLHISPAAPPRFAAAARRALALFGSTSPSWLVLASLDRCNAGLSADYPARLAGTVRMLDAVKRRLLSIGWEIRRSDPLRLTLRGSGKEIAGLLRRGGVEPEYADRDFCVCMLTPENSPEDLRRLFEALGPCPFAPQELPVLPLAPGEPVCSLREALFSPSETLPLSQALGRVCAAPTVSCPPAVPAVLPGERITPEALEILDYYGFRTIEVIV